MKAPANKTELVIASPSDISKLDPHFSTSFQDIIITFNLFDNLTARDPDLKLIPRLATEWKATGDPQCDGLSQRHVARGPNQDTPIVVLSASARREDHDAGLEAGADAYLNKPIDFAALAGVMNRVGGGRAGVRTLTDRNETAEAA